MSVVAGWICDSFIAPSNPRMSHCSRCSQERDLHPASPARGGRDREYEASFLAEVERLAERRFGLPVEGYAARVLHRLAIGADRYGDDSFTEKDVVQELLEETPDVGAYAVLEAQKQVACLDPDEAKAWHLFEAALHGAAADYHARMAKASSHV